MKSKKKEIEAEFEQARIAQGSTSMIKGYQKVVGSINYNLTLACGAGSTHGKYYSGINWQC